MRTERRPQAEGLLLASLSLRLVLLESIAARVDQLVEPNEEKEVAAYSLDKPKGIGEATRRELVG
jgi:hypothetical protein